jgi:CHAD domain-containing protein
MKIQHPPRKLLKNMTLENAFEVMAFNCLSQLKSSALTLTSSYDIEALHQVRVGLRRFDALLEFYKNIVEIPEELKSELKWLNQQLSIVRDRDVLIHSTLPKINSKHVDVTKYPEAMLTNYLVNHLDLEEKHKKIIALFRSQRYFKLFKKLTEYIIDSDWRQEFLTKKSSLMIQGIKSVASVKLKKQRKKINNLYKYINIKQQESVHKIRIATKRLRYNAELLQSLYPQKKVSAYIKKLIKLQDCLGLMNDIKVANQLLKEICHVNNDFLRDYKNIKRSLKTNLKVKQRQVDASWRNFKQATPFWETSK